MQKYLTPAKRYMSRMVPNSAAIKRFMQRRRVVLYGMSVAVLLVTMLSFVTIRGNMNMKSDAFTHETNAKGNSITTTTSGGITQLSGGMNISSTTSDGKTSVTVNNQPVDVPQNGSVSKTITNQDGSTTHIDVSHSANSSGDSTFGASSTSTNISSHTYSQNVTVDSP